MVLEITIFIIIENYAIIYEVFTVRYHRVQSYLGLIRLSNNFTRIFIIGKEGKVILISLGF